MEEKKKINVTEIVVAILLLAIVGLSIFLIAKINTKSNNEVNNNQLVVSTFNK